MHVAVLGAGVVGVTTAYYLAGHGHQVTLCERQDQVGCGTSFANGAQLAYSYTDALAHPSLLLKIPMLVAGKDPAIRVRGGPHASLLRWSLGFLTQCTTAHARRNMLDALEIALESHRRFLQLNEQVPIECAFRSAGKLILLDSDKALHRAHLSCKLKNQHGCSTRVVTMDEALAIEPALSDLHHAYVGAIYSRDDHVADALQFTQNLCAWLIEHTDTSLRLNTQVTQLGRHNKHLTINTTGQDAIQADAVVMCLGAWSNTLMRPLGITLPIYPVRGYSVTLPSGPFAPSVSLTDPARRIVFSQLNNTVRIAGFADFVGFNQAADPARIRTLLQVAQRISPGAAVYDHVQPNGWGGYRPMTPNGLPLVGATKVPGLFLNTGHGSLGWTMACASAHTIAGIVTATGGQ